MNTINKVDSYFPNTAYNVYQDYECTLNQTDIKTNKNKFYILQLLETNNSSIDKYKIWRRYGRVGLKGQSRSDGYNNLGSAQCNYEKLFKEKTGNNWNQIKNNRSNFVKKSGKYYLCEIDHTHIDDSTSLNTTTSNVVTLPDSKLSQYIKQLIEKISDMEMMKNNMIELEIDVQKLPLGKIKESQIKQGYQILKNLSDAVQHNNSEQIMQLSSEFYTIIPYSCGMNRPPLIKTTELINKASQRLDMLKEIQIGVSILQNNQSQLNIHPLDKIYNDLNIKMLELDNNHPATAMIQKYMVNTHAETHRRYNLEIQHIFAIQKEAESQRYKDFVTQNNYGNKMLLWHGSRMTNYMGILKNSLKIAPPEAPVTGYMFDKGIYFANSVSKSANYCRTSPNNNIGFLLLCEVALGEMNRKTSSDYHAKDNLNGCDSTWGLGKTTMNNKDYCLYGKDVMVPYGKLVKNSNIDTSLLYDEFIVYNESQCRMCFLLQVKFNYI